ncbi:DUF1800 domain-containing protein [Ferruginibacter albus]|uniref:DUF1800 domain-containing protein n=1 Tax=Ferruginibacter albus TaxID=2875540 RepID=UPI001CC43BED|nr:DUF1800 domain-containing protein [Ferruginibacter albus]UAY52344.1 DUF1800 domain-containing protein [Ferruginibacter albus]
MIITNRLKNQHLLWRAGFGPTASDAPSLGNISQKKMWEQLIKSSSKSPDKINVASNRFDGLMQGIKDIEKMKELSKEDKKELRRQSADDLKNLNVSWMNEMITGKDQLREKMSLFWHGHFACRVINIYFQQELLDVIRQNALGNFGDLLKGVSKSASMLQFLNNQQNKKQHPNENFAREVMELFTMGRGNYTEEDVKEAARAFTGWGFNLQGEFVFREKQHDDGGKTFLGKTGNYNGDDIIDILLEQSQTSVFITKKLYRFLVNEDIDSTKVDWLAKRFHQSNYDIKKLLTDIFTADWFYEEKNIGTQIKSPIVLLAGIRRILPLQLSDDLSQLLFQKALGQTLFYPPNVAGWPGGKNWIDSSTLMLRLRIPQIIAANETINIQTKPDDDVMMGMSSEERMAAKMNKDYADKGVNVTVDWNSVINMFDNVSRDQLLQQISDTLLQSQSRVNTTVLEKYLKTDTRENYIKSAMINVMSTPEYQLC